MANLNKKLIAVFGATGLQGGGVIRALQANGEFKVRALTRNPDKHRDLADEVVEGDLNRPDTLKAALAGAHGVFLVTNFWQPGTDERKQALAAIGAAKEAGVQHFIWSTLPNVEAISRGKLDVPHFTGKAKIDSIVREAGFANTTFVIPPFYYQNLTGALAPQKQAFGPRGTPHHFRNTAETRSRILLGFTPGGIEDFFRESGQPATNDGPAPPVDEAEIARMKAAAPKYGIERVAVDA
jgi:uncharacterized protein YbjT (DUF2867 family)